jgi:hypothetical protein
MRARIISSLCTVAQSVLNILTEQLMHILSRRHQRFAAGRRSAAHTLRPAMAQCLS